MEQTIGFRIRQLRLKLNKAQRDIAASLGLSIPSYSKIESGLTDINMSRLKQIADYFGVTPGYLLTGDDVIGPYKQEIAELKEKLGEVGEYCLILQRKVIRCYEEHQDRTTK